MKSIRELNKHLESPKEAVTKGPAARRLARQEILASIHERQGRYALSDTELAAILSELLCSMLALQVTREEMAGGG